MLVLFPCSPIDVREIDADFAAERTAARATGFDVALIDHTRVTTGSAEAAIAATRRAPSSAIAGSHPKSGMPLAAEVRTFWARGRCILSHRYWGNLTDLDAELPLEELEPVAARVPSNFFAMDAALRDDGEWAIVELGDGQVSGLPSETLAESFYAALKRGFDHDGA